MYCIRCGKEIPADAAFCPLCGARQEEPPVQGACAVPPAESFAAQPVPPAEGPVAQSVQGGDGRPKSSVPPYRGPQGAEAPPYDGAPPCEEPDAAEMPNNNLGLAGLIVGLFALGIGWTYFVGMAAGIVAIALSGAGYSRRKYCRQNGLAVAGLVLGIVALLPTFLFIIFFICFSISFKSSFTRRCSMSKS